MAEHLIRNEKVGGSTPPISSKNWSPKTETFFLEAVDFTGVDVLEDYTWSLISVSKFLDTLGYTLDTFGVFGVLTGQCVCDLSKFFIILTPVITVIIQSSPLINMSCKLSGSVDADTIAYKSRSEGLSLLMRTALLYAKIPAILLQSSLYRIIGADRFFVRAEYKAIDIQPFFLPMSPYQINDFRCLGYERNCSAAIGALGMINDLPCREADQSVYKHAVSCDILKLKGRYLTNPKTCIEEKDHCKRNIPLFVVLSLIEGLPCSFYEHVFF